jgi:hypothetical protein
MTKPRLTLYDVAASLCKRMGTMEGKGNDKVLVPAKPLTTKGKESKDAQGRDAVLGVEIKFAPLPSERVLSALEGLEVVTPLGKAASGLTFTHRGFYYANNDDVSFSLEVRRHRDSTVSFYLSSLKFERKFLWLTKTRGEVKLRSDNKAPEEKPKDAIRWSGKQMQDLALTIGLCGTFIKSYHNGFIIEAITTN